MQAWLHKGDRNLPSARSGVAALARERGGGEQG